MPKKNVKNGKKSNRVISKFLTIFMIAALALLIFQIINLNLLPMKLMILVSLVLVILTLIIILMLHFKARNFFSRLLMGLIALCMCAGLAFGNYFIFKTDNTFEKVTSLADSKATSTSIVVLKASSIEKEKDLAGAKIGTIMDMDEEATSRMLKDLDSDKIKYTTKDYSSLDDMMEAFYNGDVDAICLNEKYRDILHEGGAYFNFQTDSRVVHQNVYYTKVTKTDNPSDPVNNITKDTFTVLVSGNDSYGTLQDSNTRSDVIMIATVNPKTHTILLTSVPRDFYVTTACDAGDGCMQGALDKITHTGIHGTNTTKRTVEQLLGIEINYTFKVGFDTVTELVDVLGGVDVYVEPGYATTTSEFSVHEGVNHLNAQQALAFARERYSYTEGDRQRTKNQQQVLMGIVKEATKPSVITNYAAIMDTMANTFSTTMSNEEITDLIKYQLNNNPTWKMEQYMVDGTGDTLMCAELGDAASVMVPDQSTVKMAKDKINAVLAGKSSEDVK